MKANPDLQDAFLKAFSIHGEIKKAAEIANVARQSHYAMSPQGRLVVRLSVLLSKLNRSVVVHLR